MKCITTDLFLPFSLLSITNASLIMLTFFLWPEFEMVLSLCDPLGKTKAYYRIDKIFTTRFTRD